MTLSVAADPIPLVVDADGVARVGRTRVTLDTVVRAFKRGNTAEQIVELYPTLKLADVYAVIAYYLRHETDVEAYLRERQRQADEAHALIESTANRQVIRERLLAGRSSTGRRIKTDSAAVEAAPRPPARRPAAHPRGPARWQDARAAAARPPAGRRCAAARRRSRGTRDGPCAEACRASCDRTAHR